VAQVVVLIYHRNQQQLHRLALVQKNSPVQVRNPSVQVKKMN
jgi:hypothetical protein